MDFPFEAQQSGPEGWFVISSRVHGQSHLPTPICVEAGRCRACLFPIEVKKELIVTLTPDDHVSTPFLIYQEEYYAPIFVVKCCSMAFRHCVYPSCTHPRGLAVAFHAECARMATQFGNSLAGYRPFTEYSFQPGKDHQRRRRDTIRILIENALSKTYGKLSPELWRIVSDDDELIRLYTIAEICLAYHQDRYTIGRTTSIWATYTTVDGIEYVSSLSRSPVPGARQIWDSVTSSGTLPLYVSSDHLGIRQIVTDSSLADVNESNPVYWQTIPIECQELSFTGDGYKLREVLRPLMNTPLLWPHPTSPSTIDSLSFFYGGWGEGEVIARMKHLTFNQQGTTGYSVCWAGGEMVSICANQKSEEIKNFGSMWNHNHSVYDEDDDLKWTYHPVAEDEYIQQIWVRGSTKYDTPNALPCWGEGSLGYHLSTPWGLQTYKRPSDIALGFVTSKGRLIIAGSYPDHHGTNTPYSKHREWLMMANTDTRTPITILVSPSANGIPVIASPKSPETTQDMSPPKQTALGPVPRFNPLRTLHYSSASLEDVVSVTICTSRNKKDTRIVRQFNLSNSSFIEIKYSKIAGILFRYTDGREASVGCFRSDWSETPLRTSNSRGLFVAIRPGKITQLPSDVAEVSVIPPEDKGEWIWTELPWSGTLEWWFNPDTLDTSINHIGRVEHSRDLTDHCGVSTPNAVSN